MGRYYSSRTFKTLSDIIEIDPDSRVLSLSERAKVVVIAYVELECEHERLIHRLYEARLQRSETVSECLKHISLHEKNVYAYIQKNLLHDSWSVLRNEQGYRYSETMAAHGSWNDRFERMKKEDTF